MLRVGLVNNMPDSALARTETQFADMIKAAGVAVQFNLYSIDGVARGELGKAHVAMRGYRTFADLIGDDIDALIVTGTEPKQPRLADEPYWPSLAMLFDWIVNRGPSTLFSCLAAHAAVLHYDGIERRRLAEKRFGLFDHTTVGQHPLVANLPTNVRVAHSRWNEVPPAALHARGYDILTASPEAGADLFIKQARNLLVFHQGHPEYDVGTLFREYRRDIQRHLSGTTESYPLTPKNYFNEAEIALLEDFRMRAMANRDESLISELPVARSANSRTTPAMAASFHAWLSGVVAQRADEAIAVGGLR